MNQPSNKTKNKKRIFLAAGGTGGTTVPLVSVWEELKKIFPHAEYYFLLSDTAFDRDMAKSYKMDAEYLPVAKLRRYFDIRNILLPIVLLISLIKSIRIFFSFRPHVVVGAGSFVQVPAVFASKLFGSKILLHQQDVKPSLSNRICNRLADVMTVTLPISQNDFSTTFFAFDLDKLKSKVVVTGNPVRINSKLSKEEAYKNLKADPAYPTIFVMGGGTGSLALNEFIESNLPELLKSFNVVHSTGGRSAYNRKHARYIARDYFTDTSSCYAASDFVICRSGMSTISELSYLGKMAIIVPIPRSQQEENAWYLDGSKSAIVLEQEELGRVDLVKMLKYLLHKPQVAEKYKQSIKKLMPKNSAHLIAVEISKLL